ncbi:dihydrolipoamide dehydrogenase [Hathewaya proteolytica DSM 3090]|uniref:Dihydrolipoyl dehydrogenase n=1 Tax=Hathewaya proteolytica DSM 3090 TaxID=1121331 RepID=A0A1M6SP94_9CLOT|nr:dihydrolipoyl dehydrogenase [Hathewaya proteolytica]SHK46523.1 dihydrolipoamide dehydrogenase [Hathewaya proteolytica DSM 3090]
MNKFQLVVIGAGPGGYVAAIRASQLGLKTAVIENRQVGGTCLNRGCVPTKSMLHAAEVYAEIKHAGKLGINVENVTFDIEAVYNRKEETIDGLRKGIEQLFKSNGVELLNGTATIVGEHQIMFVDAEGNSQDIEADNIIIATGSVPSKPPIEGSNLPNVVTSDDLLGMNTMYDHLIVAGGGVIGMEFASLYNSFGKEVTVIELMDKILLRTDKEVSQNLAMIMKKRGVKINTKSMVKSISQEPDGKLKCTYATGDKESSVVGDAVLLALGRRPNTTYLFGQGFSVEMSPRGFVVTDETYRTSVKNIYAIGDVNGGIQLAHVASAQGIIAVEHILGKEPSIDINVVPDCVYTNPEIANVGLTEEDAKEKGINYSVGKASMLSNCRSTIAMQDRGFIKVVYDNDKDCIIGAQLMCARATDQINEFATAIVNKLNKEQLASVIRPHPTFGEAATEAIEDLDGMAIHVVKKKSLK